MASLEDLFYQIFNRKNWIVDQLKQQQHLYDQSLASSLLINQIRPPSWLWNNKANLPELKKEELISDLLFLPQKTTATSSIGCYPHNRLLVKGDNGQFSDSFFTETCASNRYFNAENRLPEASKSFISENEVGQRFSIKEVAATDSLDASHQVQELPENVEDCSILDHSLPRIQRSKSRQKAIELRNSEELKRKKRSSEVNITNENTGSITRSRTCFQQSSCLVEEPKSLEHGEGDMETKLPSKTRITSEHGGRITGSSISIPQQPSHVDESSEIIKSSNQRYGECPHAAAGMSAIETASRAPGGKNVDGGLNPNLIDLRSRHSLEANSGHSNCYALIQKSDLQASGTKNSRRRESDPAEDIFEPKQLVFDDIEECDKLKRTQSSKREDIEYFQRKDNSSKGKLLLEKEEKPSVESMNKELLEHDEEGLDIEKVSCPPGHVRAEIWNEALGNTSLISKDQNLAYIDSVDGFKGVSSKTDAGNQILESAVSILEVDVNSKMVDGGNHDIGTSLCESCGEANIVLGDFQLTSVASGAGLNFTSTNPDIDIVFPYTEKIETLFVAQEIGVPESASDAAGKSILKEVLTPEAAQIRNAGDEAAYFLRNCSANDDKKFVFPDVVAKSVLKDTITPEVAPICSIGEGGPYFLRSRSTGHDKDVDSARSTECQTIGNSSQLAKAPRKSAQICCEGQKAPYNTRSHSTCHDKNADSVNSNGFSNACETSWPPFKRRKIDNQPNLTFASQLRRVKPVLQINDDDIYKYPRSPKYTSELTKEFLNFVPVEVGDQQSNEVVDPLEVEMDQSMEHRNKEESGSSPRLQLLCSPVSSKEGKCNSRRKGQAEMTSGLFKQVCQESSIDFGLKDQVDGRTEESTGVLNVGRWSTSEIGLDPHYFTNKISMENVSVPLDKIEDGSDGSTAEMKSQDGEKYSCYTHDGLDYGNRNLCMLSPDETLPEFEGFSVGVCTKATEPFLLGNGLILENLDLPSITETRASSIPTPLTCYSAKYRIHTTPDVCQSLPNGLLEHIGSKNSLSLASKSLNLMDFYCNSGSEINDLLLGSIESDSISSSSSVRFRWDIKRPANYTPPIGKFSERRILKSTSTSSSSEKQLSRIPELTCFRIEEDTSTNEESGYLDDKLETPQKGISSKGKRISTNRDALVDVTSLYSNQSISISETEKFLERSVESVNAEKNLVRTQVGSNQKIENFYGSSRRYTTEDKENHNFSLVGAEKAKGSLRRRVLTPKLSSNAVKGNGSWRPNNIVSNISSFLPFVQQKPQAPSLLTGKRDIKVKALEVAEAAKRLEEKKENERKMRKEAAKIERAKIEAENLKQLEMKKNQKVEDRKKKEAEMASKKRQREEEEKEKEKKRKCLEETRRQQQKEHGDKLRAEKEEKEQRRKVLEEKERKKKELAEEAKKQHKAEKARGAGCRKRTESETTNTMPSTGGSREESRNHENSVAFEKLGGIDKVNNSKDTFEMASVKTISIIGVRDDSQSYEITPYKGSDDEEEDDDLTPKKFLPQWARKENLVPDLLLQQKINPDEMFLRAKCFNLNEVLGTRKLRPW